MRFYEKICKRLERKIPKDLMKYLPRSYNILGKVLVFKLNPKLYRYRKIIAKATMEILPYIKTVCIDNGIADMTRKPNIEVLAGNGTETVHSEYGCKFKLDVSKIMWSKGNKNEKLRLISLIKPSEVILDMFAGIGYWSIPIAKHTEVGKIYAVDINPDAVKYLRQNVFLNEVEDKIEVIEGDCMKVKFERKFDRIIMGWLFETEKFLPKALEFSKKGTVIHMHRTVPMEKVNIFTDKIKNICKNYNFSSDINPIKIKNYAPRIWHVVYDITLV